MTTTSSREAINSQTVISDLIDITVPQQLFNISTALVSENKIREDLVEPEQTPSTRDETSGLSLGERSEQVQSSMLEVSITTAPIISTREEIIDSSTPAQHIDH